MNRLATHPNPVRRFLTGLVTVLGAFLLAPDADAQTIRVPQQANVQQALNRVADGGVVEIAAGVYPSPDRGFRVDLKNRSFTVRAAAGAQVVLTGAGTNEILRIEGGAGSNGATVRFERLRFENGRSDQATLGGAVTVARGTAVFQGCEFRNNRATTVNTGGGALLVNNTGRVRIADSLFEGNSSRLRGGAIEFSATGGTIERTRFLRNRVNVAPHVPNAVGGAIHMLDADVTLRRSHFEGNEAGFAGGALNLFGRWREPLATPAARLSVEDSTFVANRVFGDPCCAIQARTFGGALHVEDHATATIRGSHFLRNQAVAGGAVDTYRGVVDVEDSVFRNNEALTVGGREGAGGAVQVTSADFADATTNGGAVNRRPGSFSARHTLFQGRASGVGNVANQGGCLHAGGDAGRVFGVNGVPAQGTVADNRAQVNLSDVIFADCDADGLGGGIFARLVNLSVRKSLFVDSDADSGGGILGLGYNRVVIDDSTFADNTGTNSGGGAALLGSDVTITNSRFFRNRNRNGRSEPISSSAGAGLFIGPHLAPREASAATGVVRESLFVDNEGLAIFDSALIEGPGNRTRYDGNRFRETSYGGRVYRHALGSSSGRTPAELNSLVIRGVDKSQGANTGLGTAPRVGQVVSAPSRIPAPALPGTNLGPLPTYLGYAVVGGAGRLAGAALPDADGLRTVSSPGIYSLTVGGVEVDTATVAGNGCGGGRTLCLGPGDRYEVEIDFRDFSGNTGRGQVVPLETTDSGLFFFFDEDNWEVLVKVLNGCPVNGNVWVFAAAVTNVEYTLRVTDRLTGQVASYTNPLGVAAPAVTDTAALQSCGVGQNVGLEIPTDDPAFVSEELKKLETGLADAPQHGQGACIAGDTSLCLNRNRFRVEVAFEDFTGFRGNGRAVAQSTDDSGLFYFFDRDNWEILVKVLDGCPLNDRFWVFSAATTNVAYTLRVTDTETGAFREYRNPLGVSARAVTDTDAFAACP